MNIRTTLIGALFYIILTFPLAVVWHVLLFEDTYLKFGYFEGEPNFILGFLTICVQGIVLSFLYPFFRFEGASIKRGLKYACLMGIFFWSSHVLAFVAKQAVENSMFFVFMESCYLCIQFGVYGLCIGMIHKEKI